MKAKEAKITVQPQDDSKDITYTITAEEEEGLTSFTIGDYKGVFLKNADGDNKGYETGTIEFTIPADLAVDNKGELNLVAAFEVGSNYNKATFDSTEIKNGRYRYRYHRVHCHREEFFRYRSSGSRRNRKRRSSYC